MKRIVFLTLALVCTSMIFGQSEMPSKKKVAVYVTGGNDGGINEVIANELVAAITQKGDYIAVERTNAILSELQKEHEYQRSGNVDDNQISVIGKQLGVDWVCVAKITDALGSKYISAKMIDVETAAILATAKKYTDLKNIQTLVETATGIASDLVKIEKPKLKQAELRIRNIISERLQKTGGQRELSSNSCFSVSQVLVYENGNEKASFDPDLYRVGVKENRTSRNYSFSVLIEAAPKKTVLIKFTVTYKIERWGNGTDSDTREYEKFILFQYNEVRQAWEVSNFNRYLNPYDTPFESFVIKDNFQYHNVDFFMGYSFVMKE